MSQKKRGAAVGGVAPKLQGKTVAVAGDVQEWGLKQLTAFVRAEGGRMVPGVTAALDYLVILSWWQRKKPAEARAAEELNRRQGATIQILKEQDFYALFAPDRDEAVALLRAGKEGQERFTRLRQGAARVPLDLRGLDLKEARLAGAQLQSVRLDGADLRRADLEGAHLGQLRNVRLDGARLVRAFVQYLTDCSLQGADLTQAHLNPAQYQQCDLTGASLRTVFGAYTQAAGCVFKNADLREAGLHESNFHQADFAGADLSSADASKCDFREANLSRVKLVKANLTDANLTGADLRGADLRDALLVGADLRGALIDGADFTGANVSGARLDGLDPAEARGLDPARASEGGKVGPNIRELEKVAAKSNRLETAAIIDLKDGKVGLHVTVRGKSHWVATKETLPQLISHSGGQTLSATLLDLARKWTGGTLRLDSITAKASKCPLKSGELRQLATAAWCEATGVAPPAPEETETRHRTLKTTRQELRQRLLAGLRSGSAGVKAWNQLTQEERKAVGDFRRADLAGAKVSGVDLQGLDFEKANFEGANLARALLGNYARFRGANFRGANLQGARAGIGRFSSADFTGASLQKARLRVCTFQNANFQGADLSGADLGYADLRGADLSTANLSGVNWERTRYNEKTRWPRGFVPPEGLVWKGKGTDPRALRAVRTRKRSGPIDFDTLLRRLAKAVDPGRLERALATLKEDRFRLYAEIADDHLIGVVKSQSDPKLVYSCRLTAEGEFGCCTQKLNLCGGLSGALCKHLLVLLVGLAKAGELDPARASDWSEASRLRKPALDREALSEALLRYKGAEAGQIDWRPTETIPEDFYAL
jgi:uncharacterized protein YjbI with pentapeptide repeats